MWQNTNDWLCICYILYRNTHKSIQALQENIFSLMYDIHKYHLSLYDQALHAKQIAGFPMGFYVVSSNLPVSQYSASSCCSRGYKALSAEPGGKPRGPLWQAICCYSWDEHRYELLQQRFFTCQETNLLGERSTSISETGKKKKKKNICSQSQKACAT